MYKNFGSPRFLFPRDIVGKLARAIELQKAGSTSKIIIAEFTRATRARDSIKSNEYIPKLMPLQHHHTLRAFYTDSTARMQSRAHYRAT